MPLGKNEQCTAVRLSRLLSTSSVSNVARMFHSNSIDCCGGVIFLPTFITTNLKNNARKFCLQAKKNS